MANDFASHDGCTIQEREDVLDEGLLVTLFHNHVGYLDHWIFLRL
jgi:hypothetical protein